MHIAALDRRVLDLYEIICECYSSDIRFGHCGYSRNYKHVGAGCDLRIAAGGQVDIAHLVFQGRPVD